MPGAEAEGSAQQAKEGGGSQGTAAEKGERDAQRAMDMVTGMLGIHRCHGETLVDCPYWIIVINPNMQQLGILILPILLI